MENKIKIQVYYKLPEEAVLIRQAVFVAQHAAFLKIKNLVHT